MTQVHRKSNFSSSDVYTNTWQLVHAQQWIDYARLAGNS